MASVLQVQEKLKLKKKRKRRRRKSLLIILILASSITFLLKSPYFIIDKVEVTGMERIPLKLIENELEGIKGTNIFLFRTRDIKEILSHQEYFKEIKVNRKLPNEIGIDIDEKKPEINYLENGLISLLTDDGTLLEIGANEIEDGCTLIDIVELPSLGENIYKDDQEKRDFLAEFRDLQKRNMSDIKIKTIDLRDMKNIKSEYKNLEIRLGYKDSLKNKLNKAINIIEEGEFENKKGYIDISIPDKPVIFIE